MKNEAVFGPNWPKDTLNKLRMVTIVPRLKAAANSLAYTFGGFLILFLFWGFIANLPGKPLPGPLTTLKVLFELLAHPFYDNGPNDKGIGIQLFGSLQRVFIGFGLGSLVAIPLGIVMGASHTLQKLFNPIVQVLRPVSPLAWFPIGLAVFKHAGEATIFVIFITSLWSTVINTAFGVASVPQDHKNVARAFAFSQTRYLRRVLIPFALPHILTGLRLSLGIAWVVIVAGEMLSGGLGIGFFVWDSWNALSLERVLSAIMLIGFIGLLLDRCFDWLAKRVAYTT